MCSYGESNDLKAVKTSLALLAGRCVNVVTILTMRPASEEERHLFPPLIPYKTLTALSKSCVAQDITLSGFNKPIGSLKGVTRKGAKVAKALRAVLTSAKQINCNLSSAVASLRLDAWTLDKE